MGDAGGFIVGIAAGVAACVPVALSVTSSLRRRCRMLELDHDALLCALMMQDKHFRRGIKGIERRCTCGAAEGATASLPPPPKPGFAARRKQEGGDA